MPVKYLNSISEFQHLMRNFPRQLVILNFTATWCGLCKIISTEQLSLSYPNIIFYKVNIDDFPELAIKFKVNSVPNFQFIINGCVVHRLSSCNIQLLQKCVNELYIKVSNLPHKFSSTNQYYVPAYLDDEHNQLVHPYQID